MLTLTPDAQRRAQVFIESRARPLEQARYAYHFQSGPREAVIDELARFQNPDGGFGRALEPDFRLSDSSALATTTALQLLREMGAQPGHPLVVDAMRYLLATYDAEHAAWPIIPANADDAPHAPWWRYNPDLTAHYANPRPEIAGYCLDYADHVPAALRESLLEAVLAHLETMPDRVEGFDDLLCYVRLAATRALPEAARTRLLRKLSPMIDASVAHDPSTWDGYAFKPLKAVRSPKSPFANLLIDPIQRNLDYEITHQGEDGAWHPNWSWGELYPDVWPVAKQEWQGVLTLEMLLALRSFGRLA